MRLLALLLACLMPALAASQQPQGPQRPGQPASEPPKKPMSFRIVTSDPDADSAQQRRWVVATGNITPETGQTFEWFLKGNDAAGLTIFFDSPGGSILGGIRLGDALRKTGARVAIGRSTPVGEPPGVGKLPRYQLIPARGLCYSSCAYAFLGGRVRSIHPNAAFGVHMFWPGDQMDGILTRNYGYVDIERAQRISANLAAYIQRSGVDLQLLQLAAATPPKGLIRRLTPREIVALKVAMIDMGEPVLAGGSGWGVAFDQKQARLATSGKARTPDGRDVAFALEAQCSSRPGFNAVRVDIAPGASVPADKPVAFNRIVVASRENDAVLSNSGKDIVALPDPFPRRISASPESWIGVSGEIPSEVLGSAAKSSQSLSIRIEDGSAARWEIDVPRASLQKLHETWATACARIAAGGNAIP